MRPSSAQLLIWKGVIRIRSLVPWPLVSLNSYLRLGVQKRIVKESILIGKLFCVPPGSGAELIMRPVRERGGTRGEEWQFNTGY